MISLYIHIPFCAQKCKYCSFQILPLDKIKEEEPAAKVPAVSSANRFKLTEEQKALLEQLKK